MLRVHAGNPTYAKIAKDGRISVSLAQSALRGVKLPSWYAVEGLLRACAAANPDEAEWRKLWSSAFKEAKGSGKRSKATPVERAASDEAAAQPAESGGVAEHMVATESLEQVEAPTIEESAGSSGRDDSGSGGLKPASPRRRLHRWTWLSIPVAAIIVAVIGAAFVLQPRRGNTSSRPNIPGPLVVIQNKVAIGPNALVEDSSPAYLSTKAQPYCRRMGCAVANTDMSSAAVVPVVCQAIGAYMVNYDLRDASAQHNPNRVESTRWYWAVLPDGRAGFISEIYLEPKFRGGLELPACAPGGGKR